MARILAVEDDEMIVDTLRLVCDDEGHELRASYDLEALLWAREGWPDVILLDLWLPYLGGASMLEYLRNHPSTRRIPVVIMSGATDTEQAAKAAQVLNLDKPWELDALQAVLDKALAVDWRHT